MAVEIDQESLEEDSGGWDGPRHKRAAALAGAVAGMSMTIAMLVLVLMGVTPRSLANLVSDKIASVAGAGITEFFIQSIGPLGKELLFVSVLLGMVGVGALLGLGLALVTGRTGDRTVIWRNSFGLSVGFWLLFVVVGFALLDLQFLGVGLGPDQIPTLIISFLLFQVFGLVLGYAYLLLVPGEAPASTELSYGEQQLRSSRRRFVGVMSGVFVLLAGAAVGSKAFGPSLSTYRSALGDVKPDGTLEGEITPASTFYQVSKNAFNPKVGAAGWKLEINGLVNRPVRYDLEALRQLPRQKVYHTLTCISNPVGGEYIGNAEWSGVPLKTLLDEAGIGSGVQKVVFTCADGYKDSITIQKALEANTILALEQNGAPLTDDHGFPGRMLIPDIYGMKNAKWVTEITLINSEFEGYWQKQGWDNVATIKSQSAITSPVDGTVLRANQPQVIKGIAFAGSRDIERVEISTDNGATWAEAKIKPRLGPNSWTLWRYEWTPTASGRTAILKVRAVETGNQVQKPDRSDPFPSGSSGYHAVSVRVG